MFFTQASHLFSPTTNVPFENCFIISNLKFMLNWLVQFMKVSGGLDGGSDPPAFQRAEKERIAKLSIEENANVGAFIIPYIIYSSYWEYPHEHARIILSSYVPSSLPHELQNF